MKITPELPVPAATIASLINAFQAESGLSDGDIAARLGFEQANVVTCIRTGQMRLPWSKITPLAELMDIDPERIIELALQGHGDALLQHFRALQARCQISPAELRLLEHCRALSGGKVVSPVIIDGKSVVALLVA